MWELPIFYKEGRFEELEQNEIAMPLRSWYNLKILMQPAMTDREVFVLAERMYSLEYCYG